MTRPAPDALLASPPVRAIARLAVPTTIVMLVATATNVLFTYYVSRLGADAIAAAALVFPVSLLAITAMGGGLGSGAATAVARALGAERREAAGGIAATALVLAVVVGIVFGALVLAAAPVGFAALGGRGTVHALAVTFGRVLFGGAAITFAGAMLDSVLRGEGNVRVPAVWSTTSLVLQMVLTPILMFVLGWGFVGAAMAMLAAQALALGPRAWFVLAGHGVVRPDFARASRRDLAEILRVGVPAAVSTATVNVGVMLLTGIVARLGDDHLAAYGLGTRFDFLLLSVAYGIGAAVLTLVGLATGAGRPALARRVVRTAALLTVALLALPSALLSWHPDLWVRLFTDRPEIVAVGRAYFGIVAPSYPLLGVAMVTSFAFQGIGRTGAWLAWTIARVVGVTAVAVWCVQAGLGERAVFATVAAGNVASCMAMVALFRWAAR